MLRYNWKYIFTVASATFGPAFHHGYHSAAINVPQITIQAWITMVLADRDQVPVKSTVTMLWSLTVASFSLGGIIGGCCSGIFALKMGPKTGLLFNNIFLVFGVLLSTCSKLAQSHELLIVGRFFVGFSAGISGCLAALYVVEITHPNNRGAASSVYTLFMSISILFANYIGTEDLLGNEDRWQYIFLVSLIPVILQITTLPFCPKSPKFLLIRQRNEKKAVESLKWLRNSPDIQQDLNLLREEDVLFKELPKVTIKNLCGDIFLRTPTVICIVLMLGQRFCGIDAVTTYSSKIFRSFGFTSEHAQLATMFVNSIGLIVSFITIFLVDKIGRRILLLIGYCGMAIDIFLFSVCLIFAKNTTAMKYVAIGIICTLMCLYSIGIGPIPWLLPSEIVPYKITPYVMSISSACNWAAAFVIEQTFLLALIWLRNFVFFTFVTFDFFFFSFVYKYMPETMRKTSVEISKLFR